MAARKPKAPDYKAKGLPGSVKHHDGTDWPIVGVAWDNGNHIKVEISVENLPRANREGKVHIHLYPKKDKVEDYFVDYGDTR